MEQQLILDRYRPLAELGAGGFATVTLAWDTRMQRRVAIKRFDLPAESRTGAAERAAGLVEARTAAMLNHPAIVTVYDFETDSDEAFLIMEHVDGASLAVVLDALDAPLDLDETAAIVDRVTSALEFAHDNGVLHLDIKPANVLITRDGRVKVADFGMAELSFAGGHGPSGGGTIGYMPLEQLEGSPVTPATDEWALAALAFECLTGTNPLIEPTVPAAIAALRTADQPLITEFASDLPGALDTLFAEALAVMPDDRFPTVTEFADVLASYLGDPLAGRDALADLVAEHVEEAAAEEDEYAGVGLWDRLQGRAGGILLRVVAAAESGWLSWAGLSPLGLEPLALGSAVALVTVAAALAPALGTALGLLAFAIGLFAQQLWVLGSVLSVVVVLWWWFIARRSSGASVVPLAAPVLGVVRLSLATPLLAGFALSPLRAAAAGLVGGALSLLAASASFSAPPYLAVDARIFLDPARATLMASAVRVAFTDPASYIALLGWPLAAFVMSLLASRASRLFAVAGVFAGGAVLWGAYTLAQLASRWLDGAGTWNGEALLVALGASLILMTLVALLGAPVRPEEEEL